MRYRGHRPLSIGGFLGMGTHMVGVRYDSLKFEDNKIVLPGGTKDGLKMLPVRILQVGALLGRWLTA